MRRREKSTGTNWRRSGKKWRRSRDGKERRLLLILATDIFCRKTLLLDIAADCTEDEGACTLLAFTVGRRRLFYRTLSDRIELLACAGPPVAV